MDDFQRGFAFTLGVACAFFVLVGGGTVGFWIASALS